MRYELRNISSAFSNAKGHARFLSIVAVGLLVVSACTQTPERRADTDKFNVHAAEEIFVSGLAIIADKYIDNTAASSVAEEGLKGLQAIDPALNVTRRGPALHLTHAGNIVGTYPAPPTNDAAQWGKLIARMTLAAREVSHDMHEASSERIFEAVFDGALSELDIFSRYAGKEEAVKNRSRRDGFGGIGIRFKLHEKSPVITRILVNTPASSAGLKVGDIITHIDGDTLAEKRTRLTNVAKRLRGAEGSDVIVTVQRAGIDLPLNFFMSRAHVVPETVTTHVKQGILTLRIKRFNRSTAAHVARDLRFHHNALGEQLKGVVLDLRGNPGGLLKQSVTVADLFLTQGEILQTKGRHAGSQQHYEAGGKDLADGLPLVVLIDGKSASAAEIVASALQDRGRAVVIGTTSFGKGSVQTVQHLPNDGELTLTWSRFVTPSGYTLHGLGVYPAVCTSGSSDVERILRRAGARTPDVAVIMASWRESHFGAVTERAKLRASCRAESRSATKKGDTDMAVARRLIAQPHQYAQAHLLTKMPAMSTAELPQ